ncbi:hypothetical protein [Methanorbis furvi]|uniref:Uncharacterized protein n=1 Tax=Methanorbis furvi TaxID=3028299 RepID=A0AAE4SBD2_9EURY|nr:hypothetical protein [Methanocorpusculaceae archaeon Ag1]
MTFDPTVDQGYLLEGELLGIYPQKPITDIYEYAAWCRELADRFAYLAKNFNTEAVAAVAEIRMQQITSDVYELVGVPDKRATSDLNALKLREERPEIWEKALSIKAADAVKLIGEDEIRKQIIKKHGLDVWHRHAHPTITAVRDLLPKEDQADYITSQYGVDHYEVQLKQLPEAKE